MTSINNDGDATDWADLGYEMPALFIGHGNPMNAIEDNKFSTSWSRIARSLPRPKAVLCISAHWETIDTRVTAMKSPRTIHDFAGFPKPLFDVEYPAPGSPGLARLINKILDARVSLDYNWGLDHGAWSVLCRMYPEADIPVVQISLGRTTAPALHYELGKALQVLRSKGVLIVGSGNIVHNLSAIVWKDVAYDWAVAFDEQIKRLILAGDHEAIVHFDRMEDSALLSVPTPEHFLPLLYILAQQQPADTIRFFTEEVTLGAISMRSLIIGPESST